MTSLTQEQVVSRLHEIVDPCSAATNVALSIVEMGMIESVDVTSSNVAIALRMTSPLCHALPYFQMQIERVLADLPGVGQVTCTFDDGAVWEPDNMLADARRKLAERREIVRSRVGGSAKTA
jgi:metal-sulfur cluster biosynthetic enzyme